MYMKNLVIILLASLVAVMLVVGLVYALNEQGMFCKPAVLPIPVVTETPTPTTDPVLTVSPTQEATPTTKVKPTVVLPTTNPDLVVPTLPTE